MVPTDPSAPGAGAASAPAPSAALAAFLADVELGPPRTRGALTLWPLRRRGGAGAAAAEPTQRGAAPAPAYVPLARALVEGTLHMDEVSEEGAVPFVRVTNDGGTAVLVLFGEELVGAKQNRIVNASFLVPPDASVVLDVSCVEYGRWERPAPGHGAGAARRFRAAGRVVSQALRRKVAARVAESRARGRRFVADQLEVWDEVRERIERAAARAPTSAYTDYVETRASELAALAGAFAPEPGQHGFVAAVAGEIAGLEAVGREDVFARVFPALLRAYAIDAVEARARHEQEDRVEPEAGSPASGPTVSVDAASGPSLDAACAAFLDAAAHAGVAAGDSLGAGRDLRLAGPRVSGCALEWRGALVHAMAFPGDADAAGGATG